MPVEIENLILPDTLQSSERQLSNANWFLAIISKEDAQLAILVKEQMRKLAIAHEVQRDLAGNFYTKNVRPIYDNPLTKAYQRTDAFWRS